MNIIVSWYKISLHIDVYIYIYICNIIYREKQRKRGGGREKTLAAIIQGTKVNFSVSIIKCHLLASFSFYIKAL